MQLFAANNEFIIITYLATSTLNGYKMHLHVSLPSYVNSSLLCTIIVHRGFAVLCLRAIVALAIPHRPLRFKVVRATAAIMGH